MDNSATTKTDPRVLKKMEPYFLKEYGNASSIHFMGERAFDALENARKICAKILNCDPKEIIFTSGATESNNLIIKGAAYANQNKGKHILISAIEHSSVLSPAKELEKEGFLVEQIPVTKEGLIDPKTVEKMIKKDTILVSVMMANNEIGTIQPIKEIAKICRKKNCLFHTDAVQAVPYKKIDVKDLDVDFLSLSAHKFYGPKGVGLAFIKKNTKIKPIILGGEQENGLRPGTYNTPGIIGMAEALKLAYEEREKHLKNTKNLRDYLFKEIKKEIPRVYLNGSQNYRTENNLNLRFEQIEGEAILMNLSVFGICVSTGSACSSKKLETSHVLKALKIPAAYLNSNIRITLSKFTTKKEIDYTISKLKEVVKRLRSFTSVK